MPQAGYNQTARNVFAVVFRCAAMIACVGGVASTAFAQQCPLAEPPSDFCSTARVIPGDVGQHDVLMDVTNATGGDGDVFTCTPNPGHIVWFEVTPQVSGPLTFSTCHPATSYDTVVQSFVGSQCQAMWIADGGCNDDTPAPECANGCSGAGSVVSFRADAGDTYRFPVGSFNGNSANCQPMCLGVIVTIGEPCGEPPRNIGCFLARELPGTPGTHEANVDVSDAVVLPSELLVTCSFNVGHTVWFKTTPTVSGPLTFTTCDSDTTFDTVLQAWTGDCGGLMLNVDCWDDGSDLACNNPCGPHLGSTVSFHANAGQEYFFQVGSYNNNLANCDLCLGTKLTIVDECAFDNPPPIVGISLPLSWPAPSGVACDNVTVMGSAYDPERTFEGYTVEYQPVHGNTWIPIYSNPNPVVNGNLLGGETWNTGGLSQGWYFLRLSAVNVCGRSSSVVAWLFVDKQYDDASIRSPANGAVLGGSVCVDGTVWDENARGADSYTVRYAPLPAGALNPVDPAHLTYAGTVLNDPLGSWDTRAGIADGNYRLRLDATDQCGRASTPQTRDVVIDNTVPIAVITSPTSCSNVVGQVDILGTASDAHLDGWALYYTGGDAHGWVPINSGPSPVIHGLLGRWNTAGLRPCAYTLRLVVTDKSVLDCNGALRNQSEYLVSVNVGAHGDFDADSDGDVDLRDYRSFEDAFTGPR